MCRSAYFGIAGCGSCPYWRELVQDQDGIGQSGPLINFRCKCRETRCYIYLIPPCKGESGNIGDIVITSLPNFAPSDLWRLLHLSGRRLPNVQSQHSTSPYPSSCRVSTWLPA